MRWVAVLTFVVGLGLGYLFGAAEEREPTRRGESRPEAPAYSPSNRVGGPGEGSDSPQPEATTEPDSEVAGEQATEAVGLGELVVLAESGSFELVALDMIGETMSETLDEREDGTHWIEAFPGRYTLEWYDGRETHRIGVTIRAGEVTTIRPDRTDEATSPPPIPRGFGRLTVRLLDTGGEPIPRAPIFVVGRALSEEAIQKLHSEADGEDSIELRPGSYEVRIGGLRQRIAVREGKVTVCVCDHSRHGEVRIDPGFPGRVQLLGPGLEEEVAAHLNDWRERRVVFVTPGTYAYGILPNWLAGTPPKAGEVQVNPGAVRHVAASHPTGSFEILVELDPTKVILERTFFNAHLMIGGDPRPLKARISLRPLAGSPGLYRGRASRLPPGDWRLTVSPHGYEPIRKTVAIGSGRTTERLQLIRRR